MNREFNPKDSLLRVAFAAAAVLATTATGAFIDALATGYGTSVEVVEHAPTRVAAAER